MSEQRVAVLKARIAAREGKPGYKRNVAALRNELIALTTSMAAEGAKSNDPTPDPENLPGA